MLVNYRPIGYIVVLVVPLRVGHQQSGCLPHKKDTSRPQSTPMLMGPLIGWVDPTSKRGYLVFG